MTPSESESIMCVLYIVLGSLLWLFFRSAEVEETMRFEWAQTMKHLCATFVGIGILGISLIVIPLPYVVAISLIILGLLVIFFLQKIEAAV